MKMELEGTWDGWDLVKMQHQTLTTEGKAETSVSSIPQEEGKTRPVSLLFFFPPVGSPLDLNKAEIFLKLNSRKKERKKEKFKFP